MELPQLTDTAAAWGMPLSLHQQAQFATYARELVRWNAHTNLTSITDPMGISVRHFLDSLACAQFVASPPQRIADVGTGAGLPGVPLKILLPEAHLTLIESIGKKTAFLQHLVAELALPHVTILTTRAELLGQQPAHREQYDLVVSRAVAALPVLLEYCLPLVRLGGRLLAPKGADVQAEVQAASNALVQLGGTLVQVAAVKLPDLVARTMIVIDKTAPTPASYPRGVGIPSRRPL